MKHFELAEISEVPLEAVPTEEFELVRNALTNSGFQFRTINGISEETNVPAAHIASVLDNSGIARSSVYRTKDGQAAYAPIEQKKTVRERFEEIRWLLSR